MTDQEKEKIKKLHLVLIGRPGSGKGTQVELIHKNFGLQIIPSPGDIYRDPEFRKTEWGKIAGALADKGEFVPDNITNHIMQEKINGMITESLGFISEGYPRTLGQVKFADKEIGIDWLIDISVPEYKIIERLSNRRLCSKCKNPCNLITMPPKNEGKCDLCGAPLIQRADDKPEAIKNRLEVYHNTAEPTIEYYRQQGKLIEVNGDQPVEKVFEEIAQALGEKI
jgi:adenylate kinase